MPARPDKQLAAITCCALGVLARIALRFSQTPPSADNIFLGTTESSNTALLECVYLWQVGASPYASHVCRVPPLLLPLAQLPQPLQLALLLCVDMLVAATLACLAAAAAAAAAVDSAVGRAERARSGASSAARGAPAPSSLCCAAVYLCAPPTVLGCAALSTGGFAHAALLGSLALAWGGQPVCGGAALGLATHLSPDAAWLLPAAAALALEPLDDRGGTEGGGAAARDGGGTGIAAGDSDRGRRTRRTRAAACTLLSFCATLGGLTSLSCAWLCRPAVVPSGAACTASPDLAGGANAADAATAVPCRRCVDFVSAVYGGWAAADDIGPNAGFWWYLCVEVFAPLRPQFVAAMHLLPRLWLLPLAAWIATPRAAHAPRLQCAAAAAAAVLATKPHATLVDAATACAVVTSQLEPALLRRAHKALPAAATASLAAATLPPLATAWLSSHALNSNFLFAANVVLGAALLLLSHDVTASALSVDAEALEAADERSAAAVLLQRSWRAAARGT